MSKQDDYLINITRLTSDSVFFLCGMIASREMYAKSYFALGAAEKQALDQMVLSSILGNFQSLTPEWFGSQTQAQTGFQAPAPPQQA